MRYQVVIPKKVQKDLNKIDARYRPRIIVALASLGNDPYIGKKLEGEFREERSYQIGAYRIIYQIVKQKLIILIIRISHRQGVYK